MRTHPIFFACIFSCFLLSCSSSRSEGDQGKGEENDSSDTTTVEKKKKEQENERENPWNEDQLMEPARLASMLKDSSAELPLIYCVGPSALIPESKGFGEAHKDSALAAFKSQLQKLSKDTSLVIYCGCCPFEDCPNVRPAFSLLEEMGFQEHRLLNLSTSLKADWMDKGYPTREEG